MVNDLLQGQFDNAGRAFYRFGVNSTIGAAGVFDVAASNEGIGPHTEDFGQTLAVYGVPDGPYMVLPIVGPSNVRDTAGTLVDYVIDPLAQTNVASRTGMMLSVSAAGAVDRRSRNLDTIETLRDASADAYAVARNAYEQHRESDIRNGEVNPDALPDF